MHTLMESQPGTFYELLDGYFLPTSIVPPQTELDIKRLPVSCMFDISLVTVKGVRVGFFFTSHFEVSNHGGYLLTSLQNKKQATEVDTVIRTADLVVYHYPNRGSLAISPQVSPLVQTIFEEQ